MDGFSWSIPFLCDCVSKMLYGLISQYDDSADANDGGCEREEKEVVDLIVKNPEEKNMDIE